MLDPRIALERELSLLGEDRYCASARQLALAKLSLLLPPEEISTKECAAQFRYLPNPEGTGKRLYDRELTPYMDGPQDALDDPKYRIVAVEGPGRSGKSIAGENHLFKRLRNGPLTDTIIYMPGDPDIQSYADKEFADFFSAEMHPEIRARIGKKPSDDKRTLKNIDGRKIQLFPANPGTVRQKQAPLIMATEIDGYRKTLRAAIRGLIEIRGRAYGNQFKGYLESHADAGWTSGIAYVWLQGTRGIWFWPCPHCGDWSSPCPPKLVPKGMHMRLDYERLADADDNDMLDHVEKTAALYCPHCGGAFGDKHKPAMNLAGQWVFDGQTITSDGTVTGLPRDSDTASFWIHGTMSPFVTLGKLARDYVTALVHFERTRDASPLKEQTAKSLGEVYEGSGASRLMDPRKLAQRAAEEDLNPWFEIGTVPDEVRFLTAAVDVGGKKFDVLITGWDLEGRSWLIDRFTIFQAPDGRELRPPERQKDWLLIRDRLLKHFVPLASDPTRGMPIACVAVDTGGSANQEEEGKGGVTWKAREFARQMARTGDSGRFGYRLMLVKGGGSKKAPEVGPAREINKDIDGRPVAPTVKEYTLNVDKLKGQAVERLAVDDSGAGQVHFASGLPRAVFDELCGEVLIDGKWERRGANETLDLFGYCEAARVQLQPERSDIKWDSRPPVWARPVPLDAGDEDEPGARPRRKQKPKETAIERLAALNRRK